MVKNVSKIFGILLACDIALFIGMVLTAMTDEKPPAIGQAFYWTLKYIFGFPLVFLNNEYPFFLDSGHIPKTAIVLVILNNMVLAFAIQGIRNFLKAE